MIIGKSTRLVSERRRFRDAVVPRRATLRRRCCRRTSPSAAFRCGPSTRSCQKYTRKASTRSPQRRCSASCIFARCPTCSGGSTVLLLRNSRPSFVKISTGTLMIVQKNVFRPGNKVERATLLLMRPCGNYESRGGCIIWRGMLFLAF